MTKFTIGVFVSIYLSIVPLTAQSTYQPGWIIALAKEIVNETDLCERCQWISPTISEVRLRNTTYIFLRYSCSSNDGFARMYDLNGNIISECTAVNSGGSECSLSDFNAFTVFTFADNIRPIWNCTLGFACDFATANNLQKEVPIRVDDSQCSEGTKTLNVSEEFASYYWQGGDLTGNESSLKINKGGRYTIVVTDAMGCTFEGEITIPNIEKLQVKIKAPAQFCIENTVTLKTTPFQTYRWSNGETTPKINVATAGMYQVTVTNAQNCEGIGSFQLEHFPTLDISIETDNPKVVAGKPITVFANTTSETAIINYKWFSDDPIECETCAKATFFPTEDNQLNLTVRDENGCLTTTTTQIPVAPLPLDVFAPNIFRPNGTFNNHKFTLYGKYIERIERLNIYDRWGSTVFTKTGLAPNQIEAGWNGRKDGSLLAQSIYLFEAVVVFINGKEKVIAGDVLLLRN